MPDYYTNHHLFGLLTPHWVYEPCMFNPRARATSSRADIVILGILMIQLILGLTSILFSLRHLDGVGMMKRVGWAQAVVTFRVTLHPGWHRVDLSRPSGAGYDDFPDLSLYPPGTCLERAV